MSKNVQYSDGTKLSDNVKANCSRCVIGYVNNLSLWTHQTTVISVRTFSCFQTGLSALHVAAQYGQIEVVREMLLKVSGTIKSDSPSMVDSDKGLRSDVS